MWIPIADVMKLTLSLVLIRVVLNVSEMFANRKEFQANGVFAWTPRRIQYSWSARPGRVSSLLNESCQCPVYFYLLAIELAAASFQLVLLWWSGSAWLLWLIVPIELLSTLRNTAYGIDGSDRMTLILLLAVTLYYAFPHTAAGIAVACFIALQSMLAYFTSGMVKLVSPMWRKGRAIPSILSTDTYGSTLFNRLFTRLPMAAKLLCWLTIIFECSFPLVILASPKAALVLLACALSFHLMIAATMGLNGFVWTFAATYPAIIYFSQTWYHVLPSRSALMLSLFKGSLCSL